MIVRIYVNGYLVETTPYILHCACAQCGKTDKPGVDIRVEQGLHATVVPNRSVYAALCLDCLLVSLLGYSTNPG